MDFHNEISRVKTQYQSYDQQGLRGTIWAPFNESMAMYRSQQFLALSTLMRQSGRLDLSNMRVLDYGCGTGIILRSFLDMGAIAENIFGVDVNEEWLAEGRKISPQISLQVCDGIHLDFPDENFDLVTQYVVFSSIGSPELRQFVAGEMWRVLKPGGYIFWWDLKKMAVSLDDKHKKEALSYEELFPNIPSKRLDIRPTPKPSETLRSIPGIGPFGKIIDILAKKQTHVAALIGPK